MNATLDTAALALCDPDLVIKAIRRIDCDPLTTREILSALCSTHADWMRAQDLDVTGSVGLALMDDAQDALGDYGDWHREAQREQRRHSISALERTAWPMPGAPL